MLLHSCGSKIYINLIKVFDITASAYLTASGISVSEFNLNLKLEKASYKDVEFQCVRCGITIPFEKIMDELFFQCGCGKRDSIKNVFMPEISGGLYCSKHKPEDEKNIFRPDMLMSIILQNRR